MPDSARLYFRAALLYLAVGAVFGLGMLGFKAWPWAPWLWRTLPAHREVLLSGWMLQAVFGVACWILPRRRNPEERAPQTQRPAFWILNVGILLAASAPLLELPSWVRPVGKGLQLAGVALFLVHVWPRVRPVRVGRCR